jgi:coenzyme PQQ biosynthesis protein PqqD
MRLRHGDEVLAQEAQGRTVLFRLKDGSYYALDDVGARIWELCDGEHSVDEVAAALRAEFEADGADIEADVNSFVTELRDEQLLVPVT